MSNSFDLFIIHVSTDERVALELATTFERLRYRAWVYELDSLPPADYVDEIYRGIEEARILLVLVSADSLAKGEEITREIHYGHGRNKQFIPLVLGLSDEEFALRVPRTWQQAFREAVRVRVDPDDVHAAARRVAEGLAKSGMAARDADQVDANRLTKLLERLEKVPRRRPDTGDAAQPPMRTPGTRRGRARTRRRLILGGALAVATLLALTQLRMLVDDDLPSEPDSPATILTVWLVDPTIEGFGSSTSDTYEAAKSEYGRLQSRMESDLLRIAEAHRIEMQIVNDDEIETALVNAGCPDVSKKFQIPECAEQKAFAHLQIRAKVNPTFRAAGDKRDLALRIGLGKGARRLPYKESLNDPNLTTLADWSAEQIALFLDIPQDRIAKALEPKRATVLLLEGSLVSPPASGGGSSQLQSLVAEAFAQFPPGQPPPSGEADVRKVLDALGKAFETEDATQVEPLFDAMTSEQRDALQRYFDNVDDLRVTFIAPEITIDGDTARAAFLRVDTFRDKLSGDPTSIAVRLVAVFVRTNGVWKVESLAKPS